MFTKSFEKIAISLNFIDRLSASGTAKRVANLAKKDPEKLRSGMKGIFNQTQSLNEHAKKALNTKDKQILTNPKIRSESNYKDLSQKARALTRSGGRAVIQHLPKVK